jgi:hypothetical protein
VSLEERLLEAIDEEDEEIEILGYHANRHERLAGKNKTVIDRFLGRGKRAYDVGIVPRYYGELLAWALGRYLEKENWQVVRTLGYHTREPVYIDVNTDYNQRENLLRDGQLMVQRGEERLIITVDINLRWRNSVLVEGPAQRREEVRAFIAGVMALAEAENFYRGKAM